jgi:REP element-mobilizing transposase RayT
MAIPQRTTTEGTFFITTITYNRRRLFQVPANAELFLETLQHYRAEGAYKLHAFIVMPDRAHLLLTPIDKTISQVMNLIKGGFSRRLASNPHRSSNRRYVVRNTRLKISCARSTDSSITTPVGLTRTFT